MANIEVFALSGISLIKSKNNRGPKMDPCGTPDITGIHSDEWMNVFIASKMKIHVTL